MEESLSKFMAEYAKRHDENSNLIKEIRALTNAAIRNQGALIKALEIQIGQMTKAIQEWGSGSLPSLTETNLRDHVKSISTTVETDTPSIRQKEALKSLLMDKPRMGYQIEASMNVHDSVILEESLPPKEKDQGAKQVEDLGPTIEECEVINEHIEDLVETRNDNEEIKGIDEYPSFCDSDRKIHIDCAYNLQFSCMIVVENMDAYRDQDMGEVIVGKPFCREICVKARQFDRMIIIYNGNDSVTYQMTCSHLRFKHLTNAQCNKM
ncbi:hypothetical protein Tco_0878540 [Tanacetum coccineum]|uniref:Uncharacterized protein n=1 Tax=Tanacetum coccineum TaxID=301880 RepID=A0ABQ5C021_9ASTR